uniref:ELMO domain-containing protein n=1 Tax=Babesia bovis TaxID=5865 RepID=S6B202_BABBO|nr:hypothetical protein [Babesia bovis]
MLSQTASYLTKMVNHKHLFKWLQKRFSKIAGISYAQSIILGYGTYDKIKAAVGVLPSPVDKSIDLQTLVDFECFCNETLGEAKMASLLGEEIIIDDVTELLMKELNIQPDYRSSLVDVIKQMNRKNLAVKEIYNVANIPVSEDDPVHCKLLYDIWQALDDRSIPESFQVTKSINKDDENISSWGDLGFQTPLSDFRMTGLLGLKCLHYLAVEHQAMARDALKLSLKLEAWFPFAITSINVTSWVMEDIKDNLAIFFYDEESSPIDTVLTLHVLYFFSFVEYWQDHALNTVFEFKTVSTNFRTYILEQIDTNIEAVLDDPNWDNNGNNGSKLLKEVVKKLMSETGQSK